MCCIYMHMVLIHLSVEPEVHKKTLQGWCLVCILLVAIPVIIGAAYLFPKQVTGKAAEWQLRVPPTPTAFTGREKEVQHIVDFLVQEDVRIVLVTGGPGYGKSSVAIASSHHLMKHGIPVCYVSLSEADSIETFMMTLSHALTRKTERRPDELQILSFVGLLREKTVIVLDNADQLTLKRTELRQHFIKLLQHIVAENVYLHLVVVTRYRFKITSDFEEIHLQPLASPQALTLLRSLIHASRFVRDEELAEEQLQMITNETGGIPLAIKVVGRLVKSGALSVAEVVEELSIDPVSTLSEDSFTPDEQLKRCIDLSYKYLHPVGKRCFLFAASFPGAFDHKAKQDIIANLTSDVHCLNQLVHRSLVEYSVVTKRYTVHALLRAFARNHSDARSLSLEDYYQLYAKHYIDVLTEQVKRAKSSGHVSSLYTTLFNDYHNFLQLFHILSANLASSVALKDQMELALETFETVQVRFPCDALLDWWTRLLEDACLSSASDFQVLAVQSLQLSTRIGQLLSYHQKYSLARHTLLSIYRCINRNNSLAQSFKTCQHPQWSIYITMLQVLGHVSEKEGALYDAHVCNEIIHGCLREAPNVKAEEVIPDKFCSDEIEHVWKMYEKFKDFTSALKLFDALLRCKELGAVKAIKLLEDAFEKKLTESPSLSADTMAALHIAKRMYLVSDHEGEVKWLVRSAQYMENEDFVFHIYYRLAKLYWHVLSDKQKALENGRAAYAKAVGLYPVHDPVWMASIRLADILNQIDGHQEEAALYFQEALDHLPFIDANCNPDCIYQYQHFIEMNLMSLSLQKRQFSVFFQHFGQWAKLEAVQTPRSAARKIVDLYYKILDTRHAESSGLSSVDYSMGWQLKGLHTVWQYFNAHIGQTYDSTIWYVCFALFCILGMLLCVVLCMCGLPCSFYGIIGVACVAPAVLAVSMLIVASLLVYSFHYFLYIALVKHKLWKPKHFPVPVSTEKFVGMVYFLLTVALLIVLMYQLLPLLFDHEVKTYHNLSMYVPDDHMYSAIDEYYANLNPKFYKLFRN